MLELLWKAHLVMSAPLQKGIAQKSVNSKMGNSEKRPETIPKTLKPRSALQGFFASTLSSNLARLIFNRNLI